MEPTVLDISLRFQKMILVPQYSKNSLIEALTQIVVVITSIYVNGAAAGDPFTTWTCWWCYILVVEVLITQIATSWLLIMDLILIAI